jgi:hypothetical protein
MQQVDEEGNSIIPDVKPLYMADAKPTRDEMVDMLDMMIKKIEEIPHNAMTTPITHFDYYSLLCLLSSLFKAS